MRLSPEEISSIAEERGFLPSPVERMIRLFDVLETFAGDDVMGPCMALVGGTALNAFHTALPRLSVDIDINYTGAGVSVPVDDERLAFEERALRIMKGKGYSLLRNPRSDTGGRWVFGYVDVDGNGTPLHIDVSYAQQPPFFGTRTLSSAPLGDHRATDIPVVDRNEVVGGKLAALVHRKRARDLFDARVIVDMPDLDWRLVRLAALVLGAGDRHTDWRELSPSSIEGNMTDLQGSLEPCLPKGYLEGFGGRQGWLDDTVNTCRTALAPMFRLTARENAFLGAVLDHGVVDAGLLEVDDETRRAIEARPALQARARLVRDMQRRERLAEERERQRPDIALRLASALTERTRHAGFHWGSLREGIETRLAAADRRRDVSEDAIGKRAGEIARRRAQADVRVRAVQQAEGELVHELEARFDGEPVLPLKEQRIYDEAVRQGLERLSREDVRPDELELAAARLAVTSESASRTDFARKVAGALGFGSVDEASKIRAERTALPAELEKGTDGLMDFQKGRLLQRLYRSFTVSELRDLSLGKGPHLDSLPDGAARFRAAGTLEALLAVSVAGPAPWKHLNEALAKSRGIDRERTAASMTATPEE